MEVLVLGDSVPAGHATDAAPWPRRLPDHVDALSAGDVTVDAEMGRSLVDCAGRATAAVEADADALAVLVHAGHNDAQLGTDGPRTIEEAFAGAARAVDGRLRRDGRVDAAAFVGLVPAIPDVGVPLDGSAQPARSLAYDRLLAGAVDEHRPVVAPGADGPVPGGEKSVAEGEGSAPTVEEWHDLTADGVHPSAAGHERVATRVAAWLRAAV
jgi:lysophospholipase L1-like esterase